MKSKGVDRNRWLYLMFAAGLILLGVAIRRESTGWLNEFWQGSVGASLWAMLVDVLCCLVFPRASSLTILCLALPTSCVVEFGQVYQPNWLPQIRSYRLGHLVLGSSFSGSDIVRHMVGGLLAFCLELLFSGGTGFFSVRLR